MANPTTAKPVNPVWDSTLNPNLQFYCLPIEAQGFAPVDLCSQQAGTPYSGYNVENSGVWPTTITASFGDVVDQTALRFPWMGQAVRFANRGWAIGTSLATPRTIALTFRHNIPAIRYTGSFQISMVTSGLGSLPYALGLNVATTGVVTMGLHRNRDSVLTLNRTLLPGRWYTVSLTLATTTARFWNIYDHTAQSADAQSTTIPSGDSAFTFFASPGDVALNGGSVSSSGLFDLYAAVLANETWDSGANTRFADFYTDPAVWSRAAAYSSPGGALTVSPAEVCERTTSSVKLRCGRPSGGTVAATYTYQWYRDTVQDFTPGAGNILTGQTTQLCTDTSLSPNRPYWYKCVQSDGTSSVTTTQRASGTIAGSISIGVIADSILTGLYTNDFQSPAVARNIRAACQNRAIGGSAFTTSGNISWKPGCFYLSGTGNSSGNMVLSLRGQTASFAYNASSATVQTALEGMSSIGAGNVIVAGSALNTGYSIDLRNSAYVSPYTDAITIHASTTANGTNTIYNNAQDAGTNYAACGVTDIIIATGTNDAPINTAIQFMAWHSELRVLLRSLMPNVRFHYLPPYWQVNTFISVMKEYRDALVAIHSPQNGIFVYPEHAWCTAFDNGWLIDGTHPTGGNGSTVARSFSSRVYAEFIMDLITPMIKDYSRQVGL